MNERKIKWDRVIVRLFAVLLFIGLLRTFTAFSKVIMPFLGFQYESIGKFLLFFVIAAILSYPMNLVAGALPKALLILDKISPRTAVLLYVLLDSHTTFLGFFLVDFFMPSVSVSSVSIIVTALMFALLGVSDFKKSTSVS